MPAIDFDTQVEKETKSLEAEEQLSRLASRVVNHLDWCKGSVDRVEFEKRCVDSQNFWKGNQWDGITSYGVPARPPARKRIKPSPVDNFFFSQIEGILGDVCDQPADIIVEPKEETDEDIAELQQKLALHLWQVNQGDSALKYQARRGLMYGPLVAKVHWDAEWAGGIENPFMGEVKITMFPVTQLFVDPRIKAVSPGVLQEAQFVIYGVRRSLSQIKETYPEAGGSVTADSYASYVSTLDPDESSYSVDPDDASALVIEYYYRGEPKAPKFPANLEYDEFKNSRGNGVHLAVVAGNKLLRHVPYIAPKYPFVLEWMYPSDDSIYCYGDGHHMLIPQLIINKSNEIAVEGNAIQAYGNWVTDEGNVRDVNTFKSLAQTGGSLLSFVDSSRARRDMAGGVAGSVFTQYSQEQRAMETVTGRLDISQGRAPRGIRAASAISMLLNQAAGRVKSRSDAISSFIRQIMELALLTAGKYYTEDRTVRLRGPLGKPIWETIEANKLRKTKVWTDPATGEKHTEEYIPEMDITVVAGAETPTSRAYYAEMATQLFQAGAIDQEALLETQKFPKWRDVLTRMQTAQQAAQSQAPPAGGGVPSGGIPPEMMAAMLAGGAQGMPSGMPPGMENIPPELLEQLLQQGAPQGGPPDMGGLSTEELDELLAALAMQSDNSVGGSSIEEQMQAAIQDLLDSGIPPEVIEQLLAQVAGGVPNVATSPLQNVGGGGNLDVLGQLVNNYQRSR